MSGRYSAGTGCEESCFVCKSIDLEVPRDSRVRHEISKTRATIDAASLLFWDFDISRHLVNAC